MYILSSESSISKENTDNIRDTFLFGEIGEITESLHEESVSQVEEMQVTVLKVVENKEYQGRDEETQGYQTHLVEIDLESFREPNAPFENLKTVTD